MGERIVTLVATTRNIDPEHYVLTGVVEGGWVQVKQKYFAAVNPFVTPSWVEAKIICGEWQSSSGHSRVVFSRALEEAGYTGGAGP